MTSIGWDKRKIDPLIKKWIRITVFSVKAKLIVINPNIERYSKIKILVIGAKLIPEIELKKYIKIKPIVIGAKLIPEPYFEDEPFEEPLGHVYCIKNSAGIVKIGISIHPENRLKQLQNSGGFVAEDKFISVQCNTYKVIEKHLHELFKPYRVVGEWFNIPFLNALYTIRALTELPYHIE